MTDRKGSTVDLRAAAQTLEDRTQPLERMAASWRGRGWDDPVTAELGDALVDAAAAFRSYRRLVSLLLSRMTEVLSWRELVDELDAVNAKLDEARENQRQLRADLDEARSWARWGYRHTSPESRAAVGETPPWLLDEEGEP